MNRAILPALIKWLIFAVLALISFGRLPGNDLVIIVGLLCVIQLSTILRQLRASRRGEPVGRSRLELFAEIAGLISFAILIPLDIALGTLDFFSFRLSHGWIGTGTVAFCILFYAAPHFIAPDKRPSRLRILWWFGPLLPALFAMIAAIATKHAYLNPFHPEHKRLAADRILTMRDTVMAGYHADWVLRYAEALDEARDPQAVHYYRETLHLDANLTRAQQRLAALEGKAPSPYDRQSATAPYWSKENPIRKLPRFVPNPAEKMPATCTIIVASVGDVPEPLLDAVAHTIHQELGLPTFVSLSGISLPPHTRQRGLLTGPQWDQAVITHAFQKQNQLYQDSLIKYVVLTPADLYADTENYLFATSYDFGAVVSFARYRDPTGNAMDSWTLHRTSKQALGSLIKCFKIPASHERACVTSYVRSLEEFDQKGNRPTPATLAKFKQEVALLNARWALRRTPSPQIKTP